MCCAGGKTFKTRLACGVAVKQLYTAVKKLYIKVLKYKAGLNLKF